MKKIILVILVIFTLCLSCTTTHSQEKLIEPVTIVLNGLESARLSKYIESKLLYSSNKEIKVPYAVGYVVGIDINAGDYYVQYSVTPDSICIIPQDKTRPVTKHTDIINGEYKVKTRIKLNDGDTIECVKTIELTTIETKPIVAQTNEIKLVTTTDYDVNSNIEKNNSYKGEISETLDRPKDVKVNGYYRKDGTYVKGHYRSSPKK